MGDHVAIELLPESIWQSIINIYHDNYVMATDRRGYKVLLKPLFRCKLASKKLNLLLNDEFFCKALGKPGWRKYRRFFLRSRMESLSKIGDYNRLQELGVLATTYKMKGGFEKHLQTLLPIVVQYVSKPASILEFREQHPNDIPADVLFDSIHRAYNRNDHELIVGMLRALEYEIPYYIRVSSFEKVIQGLNEGKNLNLDKGRNMVDALTLAYEEEELEEQLRNIFSKRVVRERSVILPEGNLLDLPKLSQSRAFRRKFSNFCISPKKGNQSDSSHVSLLYREHDGTQRSVDIETKTDQSGAISEFCFESKSFGNIYSLILHTNLSSLIFADYPHQLVAVTRELLALPYEQQPWFRGIISQNAVKALAANAPSTTTFFTFSSMNAVHLMFTETLASEKRKGCHAFKSIELHGEDISTHFPRNKFVLGLHNGGEIAGLAEHLVRRAVLQNNLDDVKRLVAENNLDLSCNSHFHGMLAAYIEAHKAETISNDVLVWLLENGAPLWPRNTSPHIMLLAIQKCDERVLQLLVRDRRESVELSAMKALLERGSTYDTLKIYWQSFMLHSFGRETLMTEFFQQLKNKKFVDAGELLRPLILMAWKFDENCLIRQLPKEIVMQILRYDGIDEPPYWDFLDFVIKYATEKRLETYRWAGADLLKIIPLVWKHWELPSYSGIKRELVDTLYNLNFWELDNGCVDPLLKWTLKFLQRTEYLPPVAFGCTNLVKYCLFTASDVTRQIFKLLLKEKQVTQMALHLTIYLEWGPIPVPYMAIIGENLPMIEILIDNRIAFTTEADVAKIRQFFLEHPEKHHVVTFISDYIANKLQPTL